MESDLKNNHSLLSVKDIAVAVGSSCLLKNISMSVNIGEIVAIVGPNGAGKSTLVKAISNDIGLSYGHITVCGEDLQKWDLKLKAQHMAVLPQKSLLNFSYLAEDVVALSRIPHSSGALVDNAIIRDAMNYLQINHLRGRDYTQLSGGEQQRVQLARVFAQIWREQDASPRLLILDEPVAALDLGHQQQLMNTIQTFARQGVGVIMVVHNINLASRYSDKVIALKGGEVVAEGPPEDILTENIISDLFGAKVHIVEHPITGHSVVLSD